MPFGLTGAPTTFQEFMNHIMAPLLRKCVVVFLDGVLVYSPTMELHIQHLKVVFELLNHHQLNLKQSKCMFLGHVISAKGIAIDPRKVQIVQELPVPTNVKELHNFLGIYRKFVHHFGIISKPLANLWRKGIVFVWTDDAQQSFDTLKLSLAQAAVLGTPNFQKPFVIETDASGDRIGAVLQQYAHFLCLAHPFTALSVAKLYCGRSCSSWQEPNCVSAVPIILNQSDGHTE